MRHRFTRPIMVARSLAVAAGLLALAGCDEIDPLKRPYMWHASGANEQNIATMAANPADLIRGRDQQRHRVAVESDGVDRYMIGKPTGLLSGGSGGGGGGGGGAPATGGGS